ncbi:MAG TPA: YciI family protein [Terriglobales bacterium]|nr:YciI family protein [Terriglobales bacterium]HSB49160.1 YciI family protein [Burkholderiales bacterium]
MKAFYAIFWKPGPAWLPGKSIFEQPLDDHLSYLKGVFDRGELLAAGPIEDQDIGLTVVQVESRAAAEQLAQADPAVRNGIVVGEIARWCPIAWDTVGRGRILYETAPLRTQRSNPPAPRNA